MSLHPYNKAFLRLDLNRAVVVSKVRVCTPGGAAAHVPHDAFDVFVSDVHPDITGSNGVR